jgi:hypothetical protein
MVISQIHTLVDLDQEKKWFRGADTNIIHEAYARTLGKRGK